MAQGWICLHRSLTEHWLWQCDEPFDKRSAWVDLLMLANHEERKAEYKGKLVICKRGNIDRSMLWLANRWHWDRRKVKRFLQMLESDGMVSFDGTTDGTTITIENYEKYQDVLTKNGTTKRTTKGTTDGTTHGTTHSTTHGTTNNNDKQCNNNDKQCNNKYIGLSPELVDTLREFEAMRKSIKKPMSDRARSMLINKLTKLAGDDTELKIRILEQSIYHSWQDIYALKDTDYGTDTRTSNRERSGLRSHADRSEGDASKPQGEARYKLPPMSFDIAEYE